MNDLTVEVLRKLPFTFNMHMRMAKFSRSTKVNDEWDLVVLADVTRRTYKLEALELQHTKGEAAVDLTPPITKDQYQQRLVEFCEAYNRERKETDDDGEESKQSD